MDRVKELATLLDDLDASAKSSRIRTAELLRSHTRSPSSTPPDSPTRDDSTYTQSQQSTVPSQHAPKGTSRRDLSDIREHSEDEDELLSDLSEMINNVPSDEEPDPRMSPPHSTPLARDIERSKSKSLAREIFHRDEPSPVRGLKSAQKTPANNKTPAKTVDFKDTNVHPFLDKSNCRNPGTLQTPIEHQDILLPPQLNVDLPLPENSRRK